MGSDADPCRRASKALSKASNADATRFLFLLFAAPSTPPLRAITVELLRRRVGGVRNRGSTDEARARDYSATPAATTLPTTTTPLRPELQPYRPQPFCKAPTPSSRHPPPACRSATYSCPRAARARTPCNAIADLAPLPHISGTTVPPGQTAPMFTISRAPSSKAPRARSALLRP